MHINFTKKQIGYFSLLIFLCVWFFCFLLKVNLPILDFILYGFLCFFSILFFQGKKLARNYHRELTQTILVIVGSYFILYYLFGVVIGFSYNTYDTGFGGILYNSLIFILPLLFREEVRLKFVNFYKHKQAHIFITVIFILCELFSSSFFYFQTNKELFTQFTSVFLPIAIENILLTYLAFAGTRSTLYAYFLPTLISRYYIPIVVDLDWFYSLLLQLLISGVIYTFVQNEYLSKAKRIYIRKIDKKISYSYSVLCCLILFVSLFIAGVFKYQPLAILTYSMEPIFTRGDIVVIEKLETKSEKNKLKKGDIIQYQYNGIVVVHRIIDFYKQDGEKFFILKGDNNNSKDVNAVSYDQIVGKVLFSVPKIGYPSVWLSEFFNSDQNVDVEVGR